MFKTKTKNDNFHRKPNKHSLYKICFSKRFKRINVCLDYDCKINCLKIVLKLYITINFNLMISLRKWQGMGMMMMMGLLIIPKL